MTTLAAVRSAVALEFNVSEADLRGLSRRADIVRARHVAMYLARSETGASFPRIARALARVNHTSVIHGIKATEIRMERDPALVLRVEKLRAQLRYS